MALLEHFRYLTRYMGVADDPELVIEFGYLLAEAAYEPIDLAPALIQLLKGVPASVEIWSASNWVLNAVDLNEAAGQYGDELIDHLTTCDLHGRLTMPVAANATAAVNLGALRECRTCRFRLLPNPLLGAYARSFGYEVSATSNLPIYVDGIRVLAKQYPWPLFAPILADIAL